MIEFNRPCKLGTEKALVNEVIESGHLSGGKYTQLCERWFEEWLGAESCLLTPSCTAALEMAALLLDIGSGDEVIMPSYTFVSTANAFVLRGAKVVFVDIRPDTLNIDEGLIEAAITNKTKAIVVVHYAGVGCDMPVIMALANKYEIAVVEDAAQCIDSYLNGHPLGSFGHLSTFSFHETKNITSGGEGGLLAVNDAKLMARAEILRDKGTNRKAFFRGEVDKYSWVDIGSSYLPSELQAAYLYAQLQSVEKVTARRLEVWQGYYNALVGIQDKGILLNSPPLCCRHNGHIFYFLVERKLRNVLLRQLKSKGIQATFHYVPLHLSATGQKYGIFHGVDKFTSGISERVIRLPIWFELTDSEIERIIETLTLILSQDY